MRKRRRRQQMLLALAGSLVLLVAVMLFSIDRTPKDTDSPSESATDPVNEVTVTYAEYLAMSQGARKDFCNSFATSDEFFVWLLAAREDYEDGKAENSLNADKPINIDWLMKENGLK